MLATCLIHGLVVDVIEVENKTTGEDYKFCGLCVKEELQRKMHYGKVPTTADGAI